MSHNVGNPMINPSGDVATETTYCICALCCVAKLSSSNRNLISQLHSS